jgi:hypothetical protein
MISILFLEPPMLLDRLRHPSQNEFLLAHPEFSKEGGATQAPHNWDAGIKKGVKWRKAVAVAD